MSQNDNMLIGNVLESSSKTAFGKISDNPREDLL